MPHKEYRQPSVPVLTQAFYNTSEIGDGTKRNHYGDLWDRKISYNENLRMPNLFILAKRKAVGDLITMGKYFYREIMMC